MALGLKDLRKRTRELVEALKRGEKEVLTYRGDPIGKIIPFKRSERKGFRDIGFGMWRDHKALKDVSRWLDEQRKPRFGR